MTKGVPARVKRCPPPDGPVWPAQRRRNESGRTGCFGTQWLRQGLFGCTCMSPIKAGAWGLSPSLDRQSGHTTVLGGEHSSAEARQPTRKELLGSSNESMGAIVFLPSVEPIATRLGAVGMVWR